jgi:hypothetical protein
MFRNRYLMNQLMVDANARIMSRLGYISSVLLINMCPLVPGEETYSVVKFMVNVRLVENRVKSHVGSVSVVKVMSQ